MADEELVRRLTEDGVEAWNKYVRERGNIEPWWRANLRDADLVGAKLCDANLSGVKLSGADLSGADLRDANLGGAKLSGAKLGGAKLQNASLINAKLSGADLSGTKLNGAKLQSAKLTDTNLLDADLSDAQLTGINLSGANLSGAKLSGAKLNGGSLGNLDLRSVVGLEDVIHWGPSTVGIDTLYKSKGKIPEIFLRGCGVPDDFIQYTRGLVGNAFDFYSCFISYSHADKAFARRLHDQLQGRGIRCWLDEHELLPGDAVQDQIDRGIRLWDKVLVCCSEASLGFSAWVDIEVEKAMQKEAKIQKKRGKRVHALIPLNLDGYLFDHWESGMASVLKGRLAADFRGWESDNAKFEEQFEKIVKALKTSDAGRKPPPTPKL